MLCAAAQAKNNRSEKGRGGEEKEAKDQNQNKMGRRRGWKGQGGILSDELCVFIGGCGKVCACE